MEKRIWLNNKCDNSEGNMCMCPKCRWARKSEGRQLTLEEIGQMNDDFYNWIHRLDGMEKKMKGRYPDEYE